MIGGSCVISGTKGGKNGYDFLSQRGSSRCSGKERKGVVAGALGGKCSTWSNLSQIREGGE